MKPRRQRFTHPWARSWIIHMVTDADLSGMIIQSSYGELAFQNATDISKQMSIQIWARREDSERIFKVMKDLEELITARLPA
jgi:hypothetical protein